MRLWDYFEQEAKKSKVSRGEEEWNLEAMPQSPSQLGLVFILCRDFRVRARMEHCKKDFICQEKGIEAAHRSLFIITASAGIHESILM